MTRVGDAPLRLLRDVRGLELRRAAATPRSAAASAARSRSRTPTPRARCSPTSATRSRRPAREVCTAVDSSCLLHIGGGLVAARRRRAQPVHLAEILAATDDVDRSFPEAARARARERAAAREPAQRDRHDPREARARRRRAARLGGAARGGPRDQGRRARAPRRATCSQFEAAVEAAGGHVHWARDAAEANAIVADIARGHGATEVVKVKSLTTDEIAPQRRARRGGHPRARDRPRRADPAARRRLVVAHPRAGDPPQPPRDPRPLRAHDRARASRPTTRATSPRRRALLPARALPRARASASAARTSASPRPARSASSSRRATAACARRCRRCSSPCSGSRSSLPRFADLEVFLQLLPRSSTGERMNPYTSLWTGVTRRRRAAGAARRAARQRPHARAAPTRSAGRRSTASAAAPASTSARSTRAPAATPTARSTRARSARS